MATLVTFHAHPDDEAISTAGTMARAADDGHRVVLVVATKGELGEVVDGVLTDGEDLGERRVVETRRAADILGVARVEFLGYTDSGMMGEATNQAAGSFWTTPVEEAARRLASILVEEDAEVLTTYDERGQYGHPDHLQVHRVGARAAEIAATPRVYEATVDRDYVAQLMTDRGDELPYDLDVPTREELDGLGMPAEAITTRVDVTGVLDRKRAAMQAHASQISETSWFLGMPHDAFAATFGLEWYIRRGVPAGTRESALL